MFIVYEGIDGSGKDTQIDMCSRLLKKVYKDKIITMSPNLENNNTKVIKEMLTEAGSPIDPVTIANLFIRNMIEASYNITNLIDRGYVILMNRWFYSTLAYNGINKNTFNTILDQINNLVDNKKLLVPDLIVYIDIEPYTAMERIMKRNKPVEKYESLLVLKRTRDRYVGMLHTNELWRVPKNRELTVDGNIEPAELAHAIIEGVYDEIGI